MTSPGETEHGDSMISIRDVSMSYRGRRVLDRVNGNLSSAAELLGVSRPTLYDLMHRFGLK